MILKSSLLTTDTVINCSIHQILECCEPSEIKMSVIHLVSEWASEWEIHLLSCLEQKKRMVFSELWKRMFMIYEISEAENNLKYGGNHFHYHYSSLLFSELWKRMFMIALCGGQISEAENNLKDWGNHFHYCDFKEFQDLPEPNSPYQDQVCTICPIEKPIEIEIQIEINRMEIFHG